MNHEAVIGGRRRARGVAGVAGGSGVILGCLRDSLSRKNLIFSLHVNLNLEKEMIQLVAIDWCQSTSGASPSVCKATSEAGRGRGTGRRRRRRRRRIVPG